MAPGRFYRGITSRFKMDDGLDLVSDVIHVRNIHCSSCVKAIQSTLQSLSPPPSSIDTSIENRTVKVVHSDELTRHAITVALKHGGFEPVDNEQDAATPSHSLSHAAFSSKPWPLNVPLNYIRLRNHRRFCEACNSDHGSPSLSLAKRRKSNASSIRTHFSLTSVDSDPTDQATEYRALYSVGGMTCAACTNAITAAVKELPGVVDVSVDLLGNSATAVLLRSDVSDTVRQTIDDIGYECDLVEVIPVGTDDASKTWKVTADIGGMTCAACVSALTEAFKQHDDFVLETNITLLTNSGSFVVNDASKVDVIRETIEDVGYECGEIQVEEDRSGIIKRQSRTVTIRIDGMFCDQCPKLVNEALEEYGKSVEVHSGLVSQDNNVVRLSYIPSVPSVTLRGIIQDLSQISPQFKFTVVHPPTLEERARKIALQERRRLMTRLILSIIVAIPTFILGIVMMMLLPKTNKYYQYVMEPMWVGRVGRGIWAMFFLSTVVYFFGADIFHVKAYKEIKSLWKPGVSYYRRFFRFGSMNLLMSLGTTISYFASIALLILEAVSPPVDHLGMGAMGYSTTYFDSVMFLTMFLLIGRLLEAYSKSKTASAISLLTNLRPRTALLVDTKTGNTEEIGIDFLEVGDTVKVLSGMSPPADGVVLNGIAEFDEAALTGESLPVEKRPGDRVFSGTSHSGGAALTVQVETSEGESMLDQITSVVRQGQMKRAPIERVADILTGYFVPTVTVIAIVTFVLWLSLGLSGSLPEGYLDIDIGGWPVWALQFAISVFVVACPCGIGLAAPTALFVGTGIAAKNGILPRGGGEAFQEGSQVDVVVFDKTGTLTEGGAPQITNTLFLLPELKSVAIQLARDLELNSTHPLARAILNYAEQENSRTAEELELDNAFDTDSDDGGKSDSSLERAVTLTNELASSSYKVQLGPVNLADISEVAGRGLKGKVKNSADESGNGIVEAVIGNEKWMNDNGAQLTKHESESMNSWKRDGKSVILLAVRRSRDEENHFAVVALFAAADTIRPEARYVVEQLHARNIATWMISGDNEITAKAVAAQVGIAEDNVIAGVLPQEKAEKITWLQKTASVHAKTGFLSGRNKKERSIVAMVGDGINDAPPLTAADVGIAIGSGSDIALSSAKFVLMSSDLTQILTLFDISRLVFRRVKFNFFWAGIYNAVGVPIAAGVIYPAHHARLSPAWASLAMAMSSVSVVCSSLALKLYKPKKYKF
ncbi:E1-E2 ATPase-domain-containing protein [Lipomyces japonicus]|uniref:E1-E2 ATPase-domain-containing protein n=1 Tax=Lipomyces japonicus TaxID=56871 RepID=UPI0034CD6EDC